MSEFSHQFTDEARSRGGHAAKGGMCADGMSMLRKQNRDEALEQIRSGEWDQKAYGRLIRYINEDRREGRFQGTNEEWLALHDVAMPDDSREPVVEQGVLSQALIDVAVEVGGPEVAWGLMVIAGQIPIMPQSRSMKYTLHY